MCSFISSFLYFLLSIRFLEGGLTINQYKTFLIYLLRKHDFFFSIFQTKYNTFSSVRFKIVYNFFFKLIFFWFFFSIILFLLFFCLLDYTFFELLFLTYPFFNKYTIAQILIRFNFLISDVFFMEHVNSLYDNINFLLFLIYQFIKQLFSFEGRYDLYALFVDYFWSYFFRAVVVERQYPWVLIDLFCCFFILSELFSDYNFYRFLQKLHKGYFKHLSTYDKEIRWSLHLLSKLKKSVLKRHKTKHFFSKQKKFVFKPIATKYRTMFMYRVMKKKRLRKFIIPMFRNLYFPGNLSVRSWLAYHKYCLRYSRFFYRWKRFFGDWPLLGKEHRSMFTISFFRLFSLYKILKRCLLMIEMNFIFYFLYLNKFFKLLYQFNFHGFKYLNAKDHYFLQVNFIRIYTLQKISIFFAISFLIYNLQSLYYG